MRPSLHASFLAPAYEITAAWYHPKIDSFADAGLPNSGDVLFEWRVSRSQEGPEKFLKYFRGKFETSTFAACLSKPNRESDTKGLEPSLFPVDFNCSS
jgi:hypothetical protein